MQRLTTTASRSAKRGSASCSSLVALLVTAPLVLAACADDGNLTGGAGHAGAPVSAGTSHGGQSDAGESGNGGKSAGGAGHGGTSEGGADHGGTGGSGGAPDCQIGECLRAVVCLDECGGNVVSTSCCPCATNTVDQTTCMAAGGQGGGGGSGHDCVDTTCGAAQSCVAYRTVGGAIDLPDTHGMCAAGEHLEGDRCEADFSYTCAELTGCSALSASCRCAPTTKCAHTNSCRTPSASAWLDASTELVCEQQVP